MLQFKYHYVTTLFVSLPQSRSERFARWEGDVPALETEPTSSRLFVLESDIAWTKRADSPKRITGRKLQALREQLFRRDPLCGDCQAKGLIVLATERDHIIPIAQGGPDIESNTRGLCKPCNEARRLKQMGMKAKPKIGADGWPVAS